MGKKIGQKMPKRAKIWFSEAPCSEARQSVVTSLQNKQSADNANTYIFCQYLIDQNYEAKLRGGYIGSSRTEKGIKKYICVVVILVVKMLCKKGQDPGLLSLKRPTCATMVVSKNFTIVPHLQACKNKNLSNEISTLFFSKSISLTAIILRAFFSNLHTRISNNSKKLPLCAVLLLTQMHGPFRQGPMYTLDNFLKLFSHIHEKNCRTFLDLSYIKSRFTHCRMRFKQWQMICIKPLNIYKVVKYSVHQYRQHQDAVDMRLEVG